jgi:nucleoside 2-deoxyribosyltransferase
MKSIYFAAPIHKHEDAINNEKLVTVLRKLGFDVWAPQEAGIASDIAQAEGITRDEARQRILKYDLCAMKRCDICLAYIDREEGWSDGQLFEMGWFTGANKPVIVYNPLNLPLTLMSEFTCDFMVRERNLDRLVEILGRV